MVAAHPLPGFAVGASEPWKALTWEERQRTLAGIVPEARPYFERLIDTAKEWGMRPWIITALRTCKEQDGLSQSAVSGCKSWHTLGRAIDVQLQSDDGKVDEREPYEYLGEWWESLGGTWGGRWKKSYPNGIKPFQNAGAGDVVHFQWTPPPLTSSVPPSICDHTDCEASVDRYLTREWKKPSGRLPEVWEAGTIPTPIMTVKSKPNVTDLVLVGLSVATVVLIARGLKQRGS
jgi:hypothetical protein